MNAFLQIADSQVAAPVKRRMARVERTAARTPDETDKKQREQQILLRRWRKWRRERRDALLAGPHGSEIARLLEMVRTLTPSSGGALISYVAMAAWLRDAEPETRAEVLALIADGITKFREREGLVPFDDSVPGEPLTAFEQIREVLR